ncbi:MAG: hypothetical protein ACE5IY_13660 [bacterium]
MQGTGYDSPVSVIERTGTRNLRFLQPSDIDTRRLTSLDRFVWVLLAIFVLPAGIFAQGSDVPTSQIERLRGGVIGMNLKWSGEAFSAGLGSRADAMGGSISTLFPDPESISSNPAGLAFTKGLRLTLDWSPPVTIDPTVFARPFGIGDVEDEINESLRDAARNNSPGGILKPETVQDAVVNSRLDMRGGLKGGVVSYGTSTFALAASFYQPFRLEAQFNVSGVEFLAVALDDGGNESQRIFGTVNGNLNANLNVENSSIGLGIRFLPNLSGGIAYDNLNGEINFAGTFLPEGIIRSAGGDSRAFNDPTRIQYDSLFATINGDWEGRTQRIRLGVGYHPTRHISLDATFTTPYRMKLSGPFSMIHNSIRALDLNAEGDEEVLDVDILVEDNLTKTEKKITQASGFELQGPGSLTMGFSAGWGNYVASFVYSKYFDNLGYRFRYEQFDSLLVQTKEGEIHQGMKLASSFRLGIGVEQLILGLGLLFGETFKSTIENQKQPTLSKPDDFLLPFFSLGGGIKFSSHLRVDYVLSLYNSSFFRFSTTYRL